MPLMIYDGNVNGTGRILLYKKIGEDRLRLIDDINVTHLGCEYGEYDK